MGKHVATVANITLVDSPDEIAKTDAPLGKPFLRLQIVDTEGRRIHLQITTNLGEMIGGASTGLRLRHEDALKAAAARKGMN